MYRMQYVGALVLAMTSELCAVKIPSVLLDHTLTPVEMPIIGLGTGGYRAPPNSYGSYPECWNSCEQPDCVGPNSANYTGCGAWVEAALTTWFQLGGRRIDNSDSYHNQYFIGQTMRSSGIDRSDIFLVSKIGNSLAMGYNETLEQVANILEKVNTSYVDLLYVHWPTSQLPSTDPPCNWKTSTYDEKECRLSTWRAMVKVLEGGQTRAIGVSNYNVTHLEEIVNAGLRLPSAVQNPFHIYHSTGEIQTLKYCQANNIVFNGYSPFGVPDAHVFQPPMSATPIQDTVVVKLAAQYSRTPGQIMLQWQWQQGIVTNPRSQNAQHMVDNLNAFDFNLSADAMAELSARPQN